MQFPATTETFASTDVNTLSKMGNDVFVYSLKGEHSKHYRMIAERGLNKANIFSCNIKCYLYGFILALTKIIDTAHLVGWIIKSEANNPKELIKCLLLIPPSLVIFSKIIKTKPDVVHLFWGHYPSIVGYLIKKFDKKITLSVFLGAYDLSLELGVSKSLVNISDLVFTHSRSNMNQIYKLGVERNKINVVHRGVDLEYIENITSGIKMKKKKIVSAGRLIYEKRFDLVILLLKELIDSGNKYTLDIIGSGPDLGRLKLLVNTLLLDNHVKFKSHMSQKDLFINLAQAQFFFLLSEKESERLPNIIKEAMFCKCVCISSKTQGIQELITHKVSGFVVSVKEYKSIRLLLLNCSEDDFEYIANNAQKTIEDNFDTLISMSKYKEKWVSYAQK
jgi:glycosyltransferase involved in cell wall biosynthesis